eukprot:TRINITY_DN5577_c0_g1_i1.p1 TRINITY_DN5577_c0_g1~~TRINITY_DN5577_c0_g1_i1.p1  ORF type:complete len:239 (+),score=-14.77 TRINITY_DN5577_c0_g1_i1:90-719(+)
MTLGKTKQSLREFGMPIQYICYGFLSTQTHTSKLSNQQMQAQFNKVVFEVFSFWYQIQNQATFLQQFQFLYHFRKFTYFQWLTRNLAGQIRTHLIRLDFPYHNLFELKILSIFSFAYNFYVGSIFIFFQCANNNLFYILGDLIGCTVWQIFQISSIYFGNLLNRVGFSNNIFIVQISLFSKTIKLRISLILLEVLSIFAEYPCKLEQEG